MALMSSTEQTSPADRPTAGSAFVRACRGQSVTHTPVWFMRQAGRSLPEYRELRAGVRMLESCRRPDLVTEITLQPVRRHGVDAAILFSDIMVPLDAAGVELDIVAGTGPVVAEPIRAMADLDRVRPLDPGAVSYVDEAVRLLTAELGETPLIGFAGAPFTLASYLVEGGPSRNHTQTKALMYGDPQLWHALLDRLADITLTFLQVQIAAGVSAVQLFDSWVGALSVDDYLEFVAPYSGRILAAADVPTIHFGTGTAHLLSAMAGVGGDVIGLDWRVRLDEAWQVVGDDRGVQGNLDPALLVGPFERARDEALRILERAARRPGHVFNLGHGVLPDTDPDRLGRLVELVHERTAPVAA
jgi:uroporphyrinogen decarboxylase